MHSRASIAYLLRGIGPLMSAMALALPAHAQQVQAVAPKASAAITWGQPMAPAVVPVPGQPAPAVMPLRPAVAPASALNAGGSAASAARVGNAASAVSPAREGPLRQGSAREGLVGDGPVREGPVREGPVRELKSAQDLAGLAENDPVRFEGRITTLKALRQGATRQVLGSGAAGALQATWLATVRGAPAAGGPGDLQAANAALRRGIDAGASPAAQLLRPSGGALGIQHCNGVDYTVRTNANAEAPLTGPRVASLKQSHIGPGGAVVLHGVCFGAAPGRVRLVGNFPGGQLMLATPVWRHDVVYAEIPAAAEVATHAVVVQLLDARGTLANEMPGVWEGASPKAPTMQSLEVDSGRVWDIAQCDLTGGANEGICLSGTQRTAQFRGGSMVGLFVDAQAIWIASIKPTELGGMHRRVNLDEPVLPFHGRDVYRLRAPAGCVAEKTIWSSSDNAGPSSFRPTHLDGRTVAVDWTADFCIKYGWALDHDWSCMGSYTGRRTVLSCPIGTVLP